MSIVEDYDVVIIGGGQAGVPLAWGLAATGKKVALVERKDLGGSCVNFGCTPTKAAITSARVAHLARRAEEFGLQIPSVGVDFSAVLRRARDIALVSRNGMNQSLEGSENPRLIRGHGRLDGRAGEKLRVRISPLEGGDDVVAAGHNVVVNTGTRSLVPPIDGLSKVDFIHAGNWLDHDELPTHLVMIGGGYIGLEMAQFYRRMGSEVTVINRSGQLVGQEDEDVAAEMKEILEGEGIRILPNATTSRISKDNGPSETSERTHAQLSVRVEGPNGAEEIEASHAFVATGRRPNTDDLGLDTVGAEVAHGGIIKVDDRLATNVPGLFVAGDVRGGPMFTHTSWDDNRVLFSQLAGDGSRTTDRIVPYAVFTDPELGRVGMTEAAAKAAGKNIKVSKYMMKRSSKAFEMSETRGFIKVVIDAETDRILGAAVLSVEGAELVHLLIDIMNAGAPYTVIENAVHIHPTLAEAVQSAVTGVQ